MGNLVRPVFTLETMSTRTDAISVAEAARMLHGEPHLVYALVLNGKLRPVGNGPKILLSRSAVQRYLGTHPLPVTRSEHESIVWH
jgi:hypothetical protein